MLFWRLQSIAVVVIVEYRSISCIFNKINNTVKFSTTNQIFVYICQHVRFNFQILYQPAIHFCGTYCRLTESPKLILIVLKITEFWSGACNFIVVFYQCIFQNKFELRSNTHLMLVALQTPKSSTNISHIATQIVNFVLVVKDKIACE